MRVVFSYNSHPKYVPLISRVCDAICAIHAALLGGEGVVLRVSCTTRIGVAYVLYTSILYYLASTSHTIVLEIFIVFILGNPQMLLQHDGERHAEQNTHIAFRVVL